MAKATLRARASRLVDAMVEIVSPKSAVRRQFAREVASSSLNGRSASSYPFHQAASNNRNYEHWDDGGGSADAQTLNEFRTIQRRARDRERNDPVMQSLLKTFTSYVIGTGIRPQSRLNTKALGGVSEAVKEEWQDACESRWRKAVPFLEATGRLDFYDLQEMLLKRFMVDGELFLQRTRISGPNRPVDTTFEILESERVSDPDPNISKRETGQRLIREGVELGKRRQPIAYWVALHHPGDNGIDDVIGGNRRRWVRIKARDASSGLKNVSHVYRPDRPEQTRGISAFSSALKYMRTLDDYLESELIGKRNEACLGFVREIDPMVEFAGPGGNPMDPDKPTMKLEPGFDFTLYPGEKLNLIDPKRPGNTFDMFVKRNLSIIASSLRCPYVIGMMDYEAVNYSSYRGAKLDFRQFCAVLHRVIATFSQEAWDAVMYEGWVKGELPQVDLMANRQEWLRAEWLTQKWDWVDPLKEEQAEEKAVAAGLRTMSEIQGARGVDWEGHLEQRIIEKKREQELREKHGVAMQAEAAPEEMDPEQEEPDDAEDE